MANWTASSNDALHLSLVRANKDKEALGDNEEYENFHPTFTYPIYGEDEQIYGYSDLVIDLRFASGSLAQFLDVRYSAKLPSSTLDDVRGTFEKCIPEGYYRNEAKFLARVEEDAVSFRPPGEKIASYTRVASNTATKGKGAAVTLPEDDPDAIVYEVWHATWNTPGFREYHRRMQLFILLYIEAGSYINEAEDSWEFTVLYEKRKRRTTPVTETYHFVGYSSLYPFYCFPDKVRLRLSQFVIVPPYQHQGHGSALYKAIYEYVLSKPTISELTVEDPAEAFEDLRDRNDLAMLLAHTAFMSEGLGSEAVSHDGGRVGRGRTSAKGKGKTAGGKLGPPSDRAWLERWRKELKIAGRQFHRLVEMLIQMHLNPADARTAKAYRLQVKERLYRFNYEVLAQLEEKERLEKLEETFQTVCEDYRRILAMLR
ncbi:acyl-CoA N-acyltransferase [Russula earlei]|uniref:Acyl-CoA N-acyltransferase n=1 Tax=Russula earlei TaxID=71964 RepID=A0ACC0UJW7_9AGAM|nr:acyl-CoA N-acyltransferase [Russula earlei]